MFVPKTYDATSRIRSYLNLPEVDGRPYPDPEEVPRFFDTELGQVVVWNPGTEKHVPVCSSPKHCGKAGKEE